MNDWINQQLKPYLAEIRTSVEAGAPKLNAAVEAGAKKGVLLGGAIIIAVMALMSHMRIPKCRCVTRGE